MKRASFLCAVLAALLTLTGCAAPAFLTKFFTQAPAENSDALAIYRLAADPSSGGSLVLPQYYPLPEDDADELETLLTLLRTPSEDARFLSAMPAGVILEDWSFENGVVTLAFSDAFLAAPDMDRSLAAFCAALTLCQLDEVDAVTIICAGQTLFAGLMPEDALLNDDPADPYTRQLRLYFPDGNGRYLISEYHILTLDEDTSPERYVIEELLRGPNNGELTRFMPEGTVLLSCVTGEDGVCTVDLSAAFYENRPDTALGERLVLYAVVNSLTALPGVDSVRFLREGQPVSQYLYRSLAEPLEHYDAAVGPVSAPKGELDADLFLALPGLDEVTPLPFRVSSADFASAAEAVLSALLSAQEPGYPTLFPGSGSVIDVTVQGSLCTVDLSESFFVSLPAEARSTAVGSIAATLCALPEIGSVRFTVGGGPAVFDGTDWSGPWNGLLEIETP